MSTEREKVLQLQKEAVREGKPFAWHEQAYQTLGEQVPWNDRDINRFLKEWIEKNEEDVKGKKILVTGSGFGDDANFLAQKGGNVTAFDIAPTAIVKAEQRFPN